MPRESPIPVLAWTDGVKPKRYATTRQAYYAIAKRLVVAKYPPRLDDVYAFSKDFGEGWTAELVRRRREKSAALFFCDEEPECFDEAKWRRFVSRVARFLAFVDRKRTEAELLELRFAGDLKRAAAEYEASERASVEWAERARAIKKYIDARSTR